MIRPRACWGAACDLLGMSVVYPAGGTVTISKKSPLIRILSKRTDCIDCGDFVNGRGKGPLVKGGCPRERTGGFRRAAREDGAARMRLGIPPASQARPPVPPLALCATSPGAGESVFDKGGFYRYLSIRHASRAFVISPWIRVDTRSMRAAGSSFMPVRTHSSVRPTKAYL